MTTDVLKIPSKTVRNKKSGAVVSNKVFAYLENVLIALNSVKKGLKRH